MLELPTVVLLHQSRADSHHDWMLGDPTDPDGPLWTARVTPAPSRWGELASWDLTPLPAHRRRYLHYEGELSGNRGTVTRVDQGTHTPSLWQPQRIVTTLTLTHCQGTVQIMRLSDVLWRAQWIDPSVTP
jgi:hypothetical protein